MNAQFRKTSDKALASLVDPVRGYVYTCQRCNKHVKEEAVAGHICEGDSISVQGVEFVRDASMRYACRICGLAVPIVLVRAHAMRHPKTQVHLEEEEWSDFSVPPVKNGRKPVPSVVIPVSAQVPPVAVPELPATPPKSTSCKRHIKGSELVDMLRKVRKVDLTMSRATRVFVRALGVVQKRAFRRWTKELAAN